MIAIAITVLESCVNTASWVPIDGRRSSLGITAISAPSSCTILNGTAVSPKMWSRATRNAKNFAARPSTARPIRASGHDWRQRLIASKIARVSKPMPIAHQEKAPSRAAPATFVRTATKPSPAGT